MRRAALLGISILFAVAVAAEPEPPTTNKTVDGTPPPNERASTEPASAVPPAPAQTPTASNVAAASAAAPVVDANARTAATPPPPTAQDVKEVEVGKTVDDVVCRRERPTGSLISVKQCYSRSARRDEEQFRSDLDHLRRAVTDQQGRDIAPPPRLPGQ